jgi:large conductance mechanosensitive channel
MKLLDEFKQFLLRGNVVDLAVAVVIGAAFGAVVTAFVEDIVTPLIAAIFGEPDFSNLTFTINGSRFLYGDLINKVITFVTIAAVIFFLVVKPVNMLMERFKSAPPPPDNTVRECPECLSKIPVAARRCSFCTSEVQPVPTRLA